MPPTPTTRPGAGRRPARSPLPICLLVAFATLPAHADTNLPGASTSVDASVSADFGTTSSSLRVSKFFLESGNARADVLETYAESDSSAEGSVSGAFEVDLHAAVAKGTYEDIEDDVATVVQGGITCRITGSAEGSLVEKPWGVPDVDARVEGSVSYTFDAPFGFSVTGGGDGTGNTTDQKFSGGVSGPVSYPAEGEELPESGLNFSTTVPGTYTVSISVYGATDFSVLSQPEGEARAAAGFTLIIPTPGLPPFPAPGEYTHPKVGTFVTISPKLSLVNPQILSETPAGGGLTDVVVRAGLANSSLCPWNDLTLRLAESQPGRPDVLVIDGGTPQSDATLEFDPLPAGATATPSDPTDALTVRVADADLAAVRASILDGSRFIRHGREQWVFLYPVELVSAERAGQLRNAFVSSNRPDVDREMPGAILFDRVVDINQGTILLEHEPEYAIPLERELDPGGLLGAGASGTYSQGLDAGLPLLVDGTGDLVAGHPDYPSLLHLIKHGTVRDTYDGSHPSGLGVSEGFGGDPVAKAHPVHFNRVNLGSGIDLSGSVGIGPGPVSIEFEVENLAVKKLLVTASLRANATLLVETRGAADNSGAPLLEQERELFSAPLFTIVMPCGLTLTPELSLAVGAAVNVPQGLSVPIQTAMEYTATAGWVEGQPFYDDDLQTEPPTVSAPALFGQLGASVEAWAKTELLCRLGYNGLGAGPTFGAELRGAFDLDPDEDPWWRLRGDLNLTAGVEFDLLGLLTFFDAEKTIETIEVFDLDSGGPALPLPSAPLAAADPSNPGLRPVGGDTTRWMRALRLGNTQADSASTYVLPVAGTTDFLAGANRDMNRYRADGEHVWSTTYPSAVIRDAVGLPDGGFALVTPDGIVDRYDADANRLWLSLRGLSGGPTLNVNGIATRTGSGGRPEIVIAGWHGQTDGSRVPCVAVLDDDGSVLWSKRYKPDRPEDSSVNTEANGLAITPDGDIVLSGITSATAVGPGPFTNIGPLGPDHGIVMKIDGNTGEVLWATLLAAGRTTSFGEIAADPEGNLYAAGNWGANVLDDLPGMLVSKFTSSGALVDTVLIGSATGEGAEETIYPPSAVPNGGETAFDTIHDLVWANGGLWATGQIGVGNFPAGLSQAQDAFTLRLSRALAVDRFALHGGTAGEAFGAIADGGDGLLAVGHSTSFLPWPDGAGLQGTNPGTQVCRLVAKLPWEGLLRFHDLSAGKQPSADEPAPNRGAHYIYPRTLAASDVSVFGGYVAGTDVGPLNEPERVLSSGLPFLVADLPLADLPFPPLPLAADTPLSHHQLEFVPAQVIDSFGSYLDWHQQDATSDSDGDGMDLSTEFYHGTDSVVPDRVVPALLPDPVSGEPALSFPVSPEARQEGWAPPVQGSRDLVGWSSDLPDGLSFREDGGRLYLAPFLVPGETRYHFRLGPATAP